MASSLSLRAKVYEQENVIDLSIPSNLTIKAVAEEICKVASYTYNDTLGLYLDTGKGHRFLSKDKSISKYSVQNGDLVLVKPKPIKIPIVVYKEIYIDPTEQLSLQISNIAKHFDISASIENLNLIKLSGENKENIFNLENSDSITLNKSSTLLKEGYSTTEPNKPIHVQILDEKQRVLYLRDFSSRRKSVDQKITPRSLKKLDVPEEQQSQFRDVLNSIKSTSSSANSEPQLKKWAIHMNASKILEQKYAPIFGVALTCVMSRPWETFGVPNFVVKICKYLTENALDHAGLFRLSGAQEKIETLKGLVDKVGNQVDYKDYDTDVVANLLKQYLLSLPDPLLTHQLYPRFITVASMTDKSLQIEYLASLINTLPSSHRDLLKFLIQFLQQVIDHENKMNLHNISIVFGPLFLRTKHTDDPKQILAHSSLVTRIPELLIENYRFAFLSEVASIHTVKALNSYTPSDSLGLLVEEGAIIHVFKKENTMWYGEIDGRVGYFPRADITRSSKVIIIKENEDTNRVPMLNLPTRQESFIISKKMNKKKDKQKRERTKSLVTTENPLYHLRLNRKDVLTKTLPKGFDPSSFETYFISEDYEKLFGMSKEEYFKLSQTKRAQLAERVGLPF